MALWLASRSADADTGSQTTGEIEDVDENETAEMRGPGLCVRGSVHHRRVLLSSRGTEETTAIETADGAIAVDTFTTTATVTGIDAARRELTLTTQNGRREKYKAGPEVVNFDQIRIGDQVKAVLTEEVVVALGKGAGPIDERPRRGAGAGGIEAGRGHGGHVGDHRELVISVDVPRHKVTFELPDGTTRTVKAGRKIYLSAVQPGETVTMQVGESLAVTVEKP